MPTDPYELDPDRSPPGTRQLLQRVRRRWDDLRIPSLDEHELEERDPEHLRLVTLNVAHGRKRGPHQILQPRARLEQNLRDVAAALLHASPDVVALQEADGPSSWSGRFDHVATIAEMARLEHHFRGDHGLFRLGDLELQYGTALLSRQELGDPESHAFDKNWRDTKGFVVARVEVPQWGDLDVDVVSVHLDSLAHHVRRRQSGHMAEVIRSRSRPTILLGDLNSDARATQAMLEQELGLRHCPVSRTPTYPAIRPLRRLDWVLVSDEIDFACQHVVLPHRVSDHLAVVADLKLR